MVVGLEDHRIPAFKAGELEFLRHFRLEWADRGRFVTSSPFIRPFFMPSAARFPNSGHTSPRSAAKMIFLRLCATQTRENSPATFALPRSPNPRNPEFLICPNTGSTIVLRRA